jgi:hypothetical protein
MSSQRSIPDTSLDQIRPIEFITENGFSILRVWEIQRVAPPVDGKYPFMVRDPKGAEGECMVEAMSVVVAEVMARTHGRIGPFSSFWIYCLERYLANYLFEHNKCPVNDKLMIDELEPEDCLLALRWETT